MKGTRATMLALLPGTMMMMMTVAKFYVTI